VQSSGLPEVLCFAFFFFTRAAQNVAQTGLELIMFPPQGAGITGVCTTPRLFFGCRKATRPFSKPSQRAWGGGGGGALSSSQTLATLPRREKKKSPAGFPKTLRSSTGDLLVHRPAPTTGRPRAGLDREASDSDPANLQASCHVPWWPS
jgi:hypothetical protein